MVLDSLHSKYKIFIAQQIRPFSGIDLWHAVEFSRYGCALRQGISSYFQGRLPNLVHRFEHGQTSSKCPRLGSCAVRPVSVRSTARGLTIGGLQQGVKSARFTLKRLSRAGLSAEKSSPLYVKMRVFQYFAYKLNQLDCSQITLSFAQNCIFAA